MKSKIYLINLIFLLFLYSVNSSYGYQWEKTLLSGQVVSVQQTVDGGYIAAGHGGISNLDFYLIKTDANGNTLWEKSLGSVYEDRGWSVQQTTDGGFIIAGSTQSPGDLNSDVYLIKTDANGNKLWEKTFGGSNHDLGMSVQQTTDGGYIIAGSTQSPINLKFDVYLIKTDTNGNKLWEKTFGYYSYESANSVQQTVDGGYIIAGTTAFYATLRNEVYLIKTDANGNLLWSTHFGGDEDDSGWSVQQTTDGGYIVAGLKGHSHYSTDANVYLIKIGSNLTWEKIFGGEYNDSGAHSVQQTTDGGYIVAGYARSLYEEADVYLLKTDANGNKLWEKTFGGVHTDRAYSVQQTTNGGYIIAGVNGSLGYLIYYKPDDIDPNSVKTMPWMPLLLLGE